MVSKLAGWISPRSLEISRVPIMLRISTSINSTGAGFPDSQSLGMIWKVTTVENRFDVTGFFLSRETRNTINIRR